MKADEFARELGIPKEGSYTDNGYVITLKDSNEYSRMYTLLDRSDKCDLDTDEVNLGVTDSIMVYLADEFDIKLQANFDTDNYTITIVGAE